MNLPAVILFICFSAACGIKCQHGGEELHTEIDYMASTPIFIEECPASKFAPLCMRIEMVFSGKRSGNGVRYSCPTGEEKLACTSEGACIDTHASDNGYKTRFKVCCSSDLEFKGLPSLLSDGKDSSPSDKSSSSEFSTRALLAIITAVLGLIF